MFDLEKAVRRWRTRLERGSPLSPRELDELEDHLRARVDLELDLDGTLAPARAFATARHELGRPAALSREFAKAGKARWRRWLFAGWAMYAASWFLPVYEFFFATTYGYELFGQMALHDLPGAAVFLVTNLAMAMTPAALRWGRPSRARWLRRWVGAVGACGMGMVVAAAVWGSISNGGAGWLLPPPPWVGFYAWTASFLCVARGLGLRAREWTSANSPEALAS